MSYKRESIILIVLWGLFLPRKSKEIEISLSVIKWTKMEFCFKVPMGWIIRRIWTGRSQEVLVRQEGASLKWISSLSRMRSMDRRLSFISSMSSLDCNKFRILTKTLLMLNRETCRKLSTRSLRINPSLLTH